MKKLFNIFTVAALSALLLSACQTSKEPFATAGENDTPRILNTDLPEGKDGVAPQYTTMERTSTFSYTVVYTPVKSSTVSWFIDGEKVQEGAEINVPLLAGNHLVKVVVTTTKGLETSRSFVVAVRPVDGDPVLEDSMVSRLTAPGSSITLTGTGLSQIVKVYLGSQAFNCTETEDGITFAIPADFPNGEYALSLEDKSGTVYGGIYAMGTQYENFTVTVSGSAYVREVYLRGKAGGNVTLTGINLDKIQTLTVGETAVTIVDKQPSTLVFTCPDLPAGEYPLTGVAADGSEVNFGGYESATILLSAETLLWEGSFFVDWDKPFTDLRAEFAALQVGDVVRAVCTIAEGQDYAMGCMASGWRQIVTGHKDDQREDEVFSGQTSYTFEYTLNELSISMMNEPDGDGLMGADFVGHGYTLTKITVEGAVEPTVKETTIWEGSFDVTWGTPFDALKTTLPTMVQVGTIVRGYVTGSGGQGCLATSWWRNIFTGEDEAGRGDVTIDGDMVLEYTLTQESLDLMAEQEGVLFVGDGYTITKVTIE